MGLAEPTGRGIDLIFKGSLVYGRPAPDYSESNEESVRVFFPKCEADINFFRLILDYQKRTGKSIAIQSLMVLSSVLFSKQLTFEGIVTATKLPANRLKRHVETLVEDGLLECKGSGSERDFILSSKFYKAQNREIEMVRQSGIDSVRNDELVMQLVREKGCITRADVMQILGFEAQPAYRLLRKLTDQGRLVREGGRRTSTYRAAE